MARHTVDTDDEDPPLLLDRASRASRGKRITKPLKEEVEQDNIFWNQNALKEDENDDDYEEEQFTVDEFDSDFGEDESEPDDEGKTDKSADKPSPSKQADVPDEMETEKTIRKSTRTSVIVRQAGRDSIRCMALIDFLLRVAAFGLTLAVAFPTGTSDETLSVLTEFWQFHPRFDDFPAFTFFMVGNAIVAGYLVLSLPFSAVGIIRPKATGVRLLLLVCDTIMVVLLTASAAAAAAAATTIVPICMLFQRTSCAVVASFLAVLVLMVLVVMGACAIRRRSRRR